MAFEKRVQDDTRDVWQHHIEKFAAKTKGKKEVSNQRQNWPYKQARKHLMLACSDYEKRLYKILKGFKFSALPD